MEKECDDGRHSPGNQYSRNHGNSQYQGNVEFGVQCCRKFRDLLCIVRFVCTPITVGKDKGDGERDGGDHHIADMAE